MSLKFVPALVQIMAWHRTGDKPLSEPLIVSLLTHVCVTRPLWVKLKYREFSFAYNLLLNNQIVLKMYTKHSSIIVVLFANFQSNLAVELDILDERDFARCDFNVSFGRISYIATTTGALLINKYLGWTAVEVGCGLWQSNYTLFVKVAPGVGL